MTKQPAENTNATEEEVRSVLERNTPPSREPNHEEIAAVARQLWLDRGGVGGSAEDDWWQAEQIVRQRRAAMTGQPALGNGSSTDESYVPGAGRFRAEAQIHWKEQEDMENTTTGTMGNTGTQTGADLMDRARQTADRARQTMSEYMENEPQSFPRPEHREGRVARSIEQQTARIPSDVWLWAAVGSMGLSLALELSGKEKTANFVGHWAPTLLIFGLYNKMVKLQGSDGL